MFEKNSELETISKFSGNDIGEEPESRNPKEFSAAKTNGNEEASVSSGEWSLEDASAQVVETKEMGQRDLGVWRFQKKNMGAKHYWS